MEEFEVKNLGKILKNSASHIFSQNTEIVTVAEKHKQNWNVIHAFQNNRWTQYISILVSSRSEDSARTNRSQYISYPQSSTLWTYLDKSNAKTVSETDFYVWKFKNLNVSKYTKSHQIQMIKNFRFCSKPEKIKRKQIAYDFSWLISILRDISDSDLWIINSIDLIWNINSLIWTSETSPLWILVNFSDLLGRIKILKNP
jgi:hypothetical protein